MINLVPRKEITLRLTVATTAIAILLTLIAGAGIFGVLGYNPLAALYQFFIAPISRPDQLADLFVKACPLIIIASGLVFAYRANVWNIGAEGQMILGASPKCCNGSLRDHVSAFLLLVEGRDTMVSLVW